MPDLNFAKPDGTVRVSKPDGAVGWYIVGDFANVNGIARNRIAHIKPDGSVDRWNPAPNSSVETIEVSRNTVYVSGNLSTIGGKPRNGLAALNATTGLATEWNPNHFGTVFCIRAKGNAVYMGGDFNSMLQTR